MGWWVTRGTGLIALASFAGACGGETDTHTPSNASGGATVTKASGGTGGSGGSDRVPPPLASGGTPSTATGGAPVATGGTTPVASGGTTSHDGGADSDASDDAGPPSSRRLCDGSNELRLSVSTHSVLGNPDMGLVLQTKNGGSYFHVRGDCRYWATVGEGRVKTGLLGAAEEEELSRDLSYGEWRERGFLDVPPSPGSMSTLSFSDAATTRHFACYRPCDITNAPPGLNAFVDAGWRWLEKLDLEGERVSGPLRYATVDDESNWKALVVSNRVPPATWPLANPLADAILREDLASGGYQGRDGVLLTDPEQIRVMRALWDAYTPGPYARFVDGTFIPVTDPAATGGVQRYGVVFRDVMPLEDANGVIQRP